MDVLQITMPKANRVFRISVPMNGYVGIVAMTRDGVIGNGDRLPWSPKDVPDELSYFKQATGSQPVIMGRKTYDSLPENCKPLPGRDTYRYSNAEIQVINSRGVNKVDEKIIKLRSEETRVYVAGGASVYDLFFEWTKVFLLTIVKKSFPGNVYFPRTDALLGDKIFHKIPVYSCDAYDIFVCYKKDDTLRIR